MSIGAAELEALRVVTNGLRTVYGLRIPYGVEHVYGMSKDALVAFGMWARAGVIHIFAMIKHF